MATIEEYMAPTKKLTELNSVQIEKMVGAQKETAKEYMSIAEKHFEAVSDIKDVASLKTFIKGQIDVSQEGIEKAFQDSKVFLNDVKAYNEELIKLIQETTFVLANDKKRL